MAQGITNYTWYHYNIDEVEWDWHVSNGSAETFNRFFDDSEYGVTFGGSGEHAGRISWLSDYQPGYLPEDYYSWKAEGYLYVPETTDYKFGFGCSGTGDVAIDDSVIISYYNDLNNDDHDDIYITLDDRGQIVVNDRSDFLGYEEPIFYSATTIHLEEGYHTFRVRFVERAGTSGLAVGWKKASEIGSINIIAEKYLYNEVPPEDTATIKILSGVISKGGNPVSRIVRAHRRIDGKILAATTSDANGKYSFSVDVADPVYIVALDDINSEIFVNAKGFDHIEG